MTVLRWCVDRRDRPCAEHPDAWVCPDCGRAWAFLDAFLEHPGIGGCFDTDGHDIPLRRWTDALSPEDRAASEENVRRFIEEGRRTLRKPRG